MKNNDTNPTPAPLSWWRRILRRLARATDLEAHLYIERRRAEMYRESLEALEAKRALTWTRPAERIPRPKVLAEFAAPLDAGLQAALHQELDDYLKELLDQVSQAPSGALTPELRLHLAGGIEHLRLFQRQLLDLHAEASRKDAELAEPGEQE